MREINSTRSSRREIAVRGLLIFISVFLSTTIAAVTNLLSKEYYVYFSLLLFGIVSIFGIYLLLFDRIEEYFWKRSFLKKFEDPLIGILKDERCPPMFTRFVPEDWRNRFHRRYSTRIISANDIGNNFTVIINPYGETYPEEDLMEFKTLERIEKYMVNGGIFVHAGGLAFFYGWDGKRNFPTGKEVQLYQGTMSGPSTMIMQPIYAHPSPWSLTETLLRQRFRVATTMEKETLVQVFQDKEDRNYVGDLQDVGGIRVAMEFRAAREPTPKCIPFLRARTKFGVVYPIAAIPYGKGYLIVSGMHLDTKLTVMGTDLAKSEFEKIAVMIENFMKAIKEGYCS